MQYKGMNINKKKYLIVPHIAALGRQCRRVAAQERTSAS